MSFNATPRPVIILTHEFYPKRGGIATFTEEIARAAVEIGHPVEVWTHRLSPGSTEKPWPFAVKRLPLDGSHDLSCRLRLIRELFRERRRLRHATVYLAEPGPMLAWMLLLPFGAVRARRLVLTFHGSEILRFHSDPATRFLTRRLLRRAFRVSTLTRYTQQLLCERFPEAITKTFRTPGALRADFANTPSSVSPLAPAAGKVIILTVGRLHPRKGQLVSLEALQSLSPELLERIEYWIVGSSTKPHYEQTLHAAAARPGLTVRFLGNLSDETLEEVYAQADIFALTSIDHGHSVEGFGLVYLEASAHGLPVIAHHVGGVSEAVAEGETGLLVTPHQPAALTEAFRTLIEDAPLRRRMGEAGRLWARRNTWTRAAELLFSPGDEVPDDSAST
ncbi:glycosyltransferase family 4 protein [Rariglobus hedericola]|uniref:Glycosyltransferase family 4 protein n=1 Tax=Rariglobus hedericola TaxID=2597822 RepID=A0A556QJ31_9BACT|nr:glycosyltransferase family 4 protein [Rariglobus hedericola]TSJ76650.1 glycosyltransferase family 4 protein [Rariglobus hedericola]